MIGKKSLFKKLDHVGSVVRDLDDAVKYYEELGLGPFLPSKLAQKGITVTDRKLYGKPASDIKMKGKIANIGHLEVEVVQPVSGDTPQKKSLESKGEGLNHLAFSVDNLDEAITGMSDMGFKVISIVRFTQGGGAAFFDTDRLGGIQFEMIQWPQ
ncbi:MAG: hypothetical protein A2144_00750 [Chloroflexi bacterium RBG_16_50_9]|nr:MAG: hypothetical protein A2144_00750 [Chloroflexi bacterium RBG_16_50_9]